jgi:hypothetical protein
MAKVPVITDNIGAVVAKMRDNSWDAIFGQAFNGLAPFYMFGHRLEIANRLKEMELDKVYKYQKYPLIALRIDVPEGYTADSKGYVSYSLNIAILAFTKDNIYSDQRMTEVFKPKLHPLYERFLTELKNSGLFQWDGFPNERPPHTKIDRPFWGTAYSPPKEGTEKYIFEDPLDAVELVDLKIRSKIKC